MESGLVSSRMFKGRKVFNGFSAVCIHAAKEELFDLRGMPIAKTRGVKVGLLEASIGTPSVECLFVMKPTVSVFDPLRLQVETVKLLFVDVR